MIRMTVLSVSIKAFRQFSTVFGIRTELGGAKGALVIARESTTAVCGGDELCASSHTQVYAGSERAAEAASRTLR